MAVRYLAESREDAGRLYNQIRGRLDEGVLVEEIANEIYPEWVEQSIAPEGPFTDTVHSCLVKMIAVVAEGD